MNSFPGIFALALPSCHHSHSNNSKIYIKLLGDHLRRFINSKFKLSWKNLSVVRSCKVILCVCVCVCVCVFTPCISLKVTKRNPLNLNNIQIDRYTEMGT